MKATTLKEKFIEAFKSGKRFDIQNAEVIAEDFAIGFGEYIDSLTTEDMGTLSIKELLEIYKKEKVL